MEYSAIDGGEWMSLGLGEEGWRGNGMGWADLLCWWRRGRGL